MVNIELIIEVIKNYGVMSLVAGVIAGYIISAISGKKSLGIVVGILVAIIICLIPYMSSPECEDCGADMRYGQNYCEVCKHYQQTGDIFGKIKCESCNKRIDKDAVVCGYCGIEIN